MLSPIIVSGPFCTTQCSSHLYKDRGYNTVTGFRSLPNVSKDWEHRAVLQSLWPLVMIRIDIDRSNDARPTKTILRSDQVVQRGTKYKGAYISSRVSASIEPVPYFHQTSSLLPSYLSYTSESHTKCLPQLSSPPSLAALSLQPPLLMSQLVKPPSVPAHTAMPNAALPMSSVLPT